MKQYVHHILGREAKKCPKGSLNEDNYFVSGDDGRFRIDQSVTEEQLKALGFIEKEEESDNNVCKACKGDSTAKLYWGVYRCPKCKGTGNNIEPENKWIDDAYNEYSINSVMTTETREKDKDKFKKAILSHLPK